MTITQHSAATEQTFDSTDFTFDYNFPSGDSDDLLVLWIACEKDGAITNVDWDNAGTPVAFTEIITFVGETRRVAIWAIKAPTARGNLEIRVRTGTVGKCGVVVKGYTGVDTWDTTTDTDSGDADDPAISLTPTVAGSLCVDCLSGEPETYNVNGGNTLIHEGDHGSGEYACSQKTSTVSTTGMAWAIGAAKKFAYCGIEILEFVESTRQHWQGPMPQPLI